MSKLGNVTQQEKEMRFFFPPKKFAKILGTQNFQEGLENGWELGETSPNATAKIIAQEPKVCMPLPLPGTVSGGADL